MKYQYSKVDLVNKDNFVYDGKGIELDGENTTAHLVRIHNCRGLIVRNVTFKNGNTEVIQVISRKQIPFRDEKVSIYEIIDGGAVVITGKSSVIFENCQFINNRSIMCGGAVSNQSTAPVEFRDCLFKDNVAGHTGAAIDNLVKNSRVIIDKCTFINNQSNSWYKVGYPHGQISVFPKSSTTISSSHFEGGSIPFDYYENSEIHLGDNKYVGYDDWNDTLTAREQSTILDKLRLMLKLYWLMPKTLGKVFYRVNS